MKFIKNNQTHLLQLKDRLKSLGYIPELEVDGEAEGTGLSKPFISSELKDGLDVQSPSVVRSYMKSFHEDHLPDESLSLKNLGLSDVCLPSLASEDNGRIDDPDLGFQEPRKYDRNKLDMNDQSQHAAKIEGEQEDDQKSVEASRSIIKVLKDDYESLPSYMKSLASWEDLLVAIEKINSRLSQKENTKAHNYFHQDEIESLQLGPKARAYLQLFTRLNKLVVEIVDYLISYRVL